MGPLANTPFSARIPTSLLALLLLTLSAPAFAVDGVLEINHTCAVNGGCFTGDTPGYPVSLGAPGSYRLTSNLVVPDENTDALVVGKSSVSIDLNGFEITRSGCEAANFSCVAVSGTGVGVKAAAPSIRGVSVRNGTITGMGSSGISLSTQSEVRRVRARWNRVIGIGAGRHSIVSDNTLLDNGETGIEVGAGTLVQGNTLTGHPYYAIWAIDGSTVRLNVVRANGVGLNLDSSTTYGGNVVTGNVYGDVVSGVNVGGNYCENGAVSTCP